MKNNKGFTLVELLVSFTLSMVLIIIMFQLIINLKELYQLSGARTQLLNRQYLMTNKIYSDLLEKKLVMITSCEENYNECINLTLSDGSTKQFYIDENNKIISYDNYAIQLDSNAYFSNIDINNNTAYNILTIKVPIYNQLFNDYNFGINIVYTYNPYEVTDNYS